MVSDIRKSKVNAFTIVEMAIIVVVLGLIVAGLTVSKSLIESAERQNLIDDVNKYTAAVDTYELKYDYKPGDHPEAEDYFGAGNTNNGNGDGVVATADEFILVWNQLSLAGILKGSFAAASFEPRTTSPDIGYEETVLSYGTPANYWDNSFLDSVVGRNNHAFCVQETSSSDVCDLGGSSAFRVQSAMSIDKKIDDAAADSGKVLAASCIDVDLAFEDLDGVTSYSYNIANEDGCGLMFIIESN